MTTIDVTHDMNATSWVESAQGSDFPIQNLPWGVCSTNGIVVAIGDKAVVLRKAINSEKLQLADEVSNALLQDSLNEFMSLGHEIWTLVRHSLFTFLSGEPCPEVLCDIDSLTLVLPATIGDYTDFYAARNHATNVGKMFRPDGDPLMPNYLHLPVGYHGRASSVVVSGTDITRPHGQLKPDDSAPIFAPCKLLDYELEFGAFIGTGNAMGTRVTIDNAMEHIFGVVILNDWSARDIQKWEYQPLGPFNAKNFATTISPWVVTTDALAPFRTSGPPRLESDPEVLEYLKPVTDDVLDVQCTVTLSSATMRNDGIEALQLSKTTLANLTWSFAQMLTHHTSTGCPMNSGDLIGSGTISGGEDKDTRGCLLEITWRGTEPISMPDGTARRFLQDGDELTMHAWCESEVASRIGFGTCSGVILSAT
ncbi:MAG: fumarylacetoacetase [Phycisphaerae bacterium]|jgi:fumarylacetoacetase|nr:fumarylacetoacetase [Phycisphaerae bacterium]